MIKIKIVLSLRVSVKIAKLYRPNRKETVSILRNIT